MARTIHVGLTGLSRAGKTVFLTSAIHDLVEHTGEDLDDFRFSGWRYVGNPQPLPNGVEPFPYRKLVQALREDPPQWPAPNTDVTEYRVHLHFVQDDNRRREAVVVFLDYPGERLVDIALLDTSYEDWSEEVWERLQDPHQPAREAAQNFLDCVCDMQAALRGAVPEHRRQVAQRAFGEFLMGLRKVRCLAAPVVPIMEAEQQETAVSAPFFPLNREARQRLPRLHQLLKQAYAAYLKTSVAPFLRRIAACSHQVILVDVLDILRNGTEKFNEVKEQMQRVLNCYRRINRGWFNRLWSQMPWVGRPQIRRVSFCATKADQATRDCRGNLVNLLRSLFTRAEQAIRFDRRIVQKIDFLGIAAFRCTDDVDTDHEGRPIVALRGRLKHEASPDEDTYYPGRVPEEWPAYEEKWRSFRFPDFLPRRLPDINTGRPLPHINMDQILFALVEGLLP